MILIASVKGFTVAREKFPQYSYRAGGAVLHEKVRVGARGRHDVAKAVGERSESKEWELVAGLLSGQSEHFDELYETFHRRVFGFALRRVGNPADAEDITQEVFLQIHRSIGSYRGRARLATWIFGIAHNVTCRHFRGRRMDTLPLESAIASERMTVHSCAERRLDAARAVERCTSTLTRNRNPEHLEIFHLFYGCGCPLRVISQATGKPTSNVKDSLRRSRNLLRRNIPDIHAVLAASSCCA